MRRTEGKLLLVNSCLSRLLSFLLDPLCFSAFHLRPPRIVHLLLPLPLLLQAQAGEAEAGCKEARVGCKAAKAGSGWQKVPQISGLCQTGAALVLSRAAQP